MSLFKSTAWYTFGNLLSRSLGFILLPFYSNLITTDEFGVYALIMSGYAVLSTLYQGGLFAGFSKFYSDADQANKPSVFSSIFSVIIVTSLFISSIITVYQRNISELLLSSPEYSRLIFIAVWMLFSDTIFSTLLHLLKTKEQPEKVTYYTSASAIFNLLLNLIFVFYQRKGVEGILLAQLFSGAIVCSAMFPVFIENFRFKINGPVLKKVLTFSLPLLIGGVFSTLVDVADRFILDHFLDVNTVGVYSFSYRIAMIMNVFVISFGTAWTPYFLRIYNKEKTYSSIFGKNLSKLIAVSLMIFLSVSLFIDNLFTLKLSGINIFNIQYLPGIVIIPFIMIGYIFRGMSGFYSVFPYVSGKSYHFLLSDAIAFGVNILLNFIMIPLWGITGAAIATMLSYITGTAYLFFISKEIKITYRIKEIVSLLASAAVIFVLSRLIDSLIMDIVLIIVFAIIIQRVLKVGVPKTVSV
ncbi:MAG: lipopolysaccharide biosynthesis protein [Bacillota bacterium]